MNKTIAFLQLGAYNIINLIIGCKGGYYEYK